MGGGGVGARWAHSSPHAGEFEVSYPKTFESLCTLRCILLLQHLQCVTLMFRNLEPKY